MEGIPLKGGSVLPTRQPGENFRFHVIFRNDRSFHPLFFFFFDIFIVSTEEIIRCPIVRSDGPENRDPLTTDISIKVGWNGGDNQTQKTN